MKNKEFPQGHRDFLGKISLEYAQVVLEGREGDFIFPPSLTPDEVRYVKELHLADTMSREFYKKNPKLKQQARERVYSRLTDEQRARLEEIKTQ